MNLLSRGRSRDADALIVRGRDGNAHRRFLAREPERADRDADDEERERGSERGAERERGERRGEAFAQAAQKVPARRFALGLRRARDLGTHRRPERRADFEAAVVARVNLLLEGERVERRGAVGAGREVRADLFGGALVGLSVEELFDQWEAINTSHHCSPPRYGPMRRRISARARCRSVFSLPTEKPVISAISS